MQFAVYKKDSFFGGRLKQRRSIQEADVTCHSIRRRILDRLFHEELPYYSLQQTAGIKSESKMCFLRKSPFIAHI